MPWRRTQYDLVLGCTHILQKLLRQRGKRRPRFLRQNFAIAFARLHQAQLPNVARQGYLGGGEARLLQLARQFVLGVQAFCADQFQNLSLPVRLAHTIWASLIRACRRASATARGPVPPGISRDRKPSRGSSSRAMSG